MAWFNLNNPNAPGTPSSYSPVGSPSCSGDQQICAINATASGSQPVITDALRNEMLTALNTHSSTSNVQLKD